MISFVYSLDRGATSQQEAMIQSGLEARFPGLRFICDAEVLGGYENTILPIAGEAQPSESSVKNSQAIEQIRGLGENRRCNLQGFEAPICNTLQFLRSRERSAASVDGLERQSDSVPFSVRFYIVPNIRYSPA
jgi:hypothetical protein